MNLKKWEKIDSKLIYSSEYFQVYLDTVIIPNSEKINYDWYLAPDFCIIIPHRNNKFVMIENYRYPADTFSLEFPAGHIEKDEDIYQAAKRELLEETGYVAQDLDYLGWYYVSSRSLQKGHVFYCRELKKEKINREVSEIQRIKIDSLKYLENAVAKNIIKHAATLVAYAFFKNKLKH